MVAELKHSLDTLVTLYPIPGFSPPTPLTKAKGAFAFALYTHVEHEALLQSPSLSDATKQRTVPVVVTYLAIGCRRKIVIYSWKDGGPQEAQVCCIALCIDTMLTIIQEASLPHTPRSIVFLNQETICFGHNPLDYALYSLKTHVTTDVAVPAHPGTSPSGISMAALSGLGGYMGFSAKPKPCVVRVSETEALIAKDSTFLSL